MCAGMWCRHSGLHLESTLQQPRMIPQFVCIGKLQPHPSCGHLLVPILCRETTDEAEEMYELLKTLTFKGAVESFAFQHVSLCACVCVCVCLL